MLVPRRSTYQANLKSGDFFIVTRIGSFMTAQLPRWVVPGATVLDIGCGEQPLRALIESLGGKYLGADITQNGTGNVDYLCPITAVPLASGSIDLVICTEVMEHVGETEAAFLEMTRLLKVEGVLVMTTPFIYPLHEEPYDFVRITPYQMRRCAKLSGLEIVTLVKAGNEFEVLASLVGLSFFWFYNAVSFKPLRFIYACCTPWVQAGANLLAMLLSRMFGQFCAQRSFLNTQVVFRRCS